MKEEIIIGIDLDEAAEEAIEEISENYGVKVPEELNQYPSNPQNLAANKAVLSIATGLEVSMEDARRLIREDYDLWRIFEQMKNLYLEIERSFEANRQ